ncbi:23S rRNA (adenine2503-C2)-methyltransferase [Clostridium acetobutylicum]|uniref:Predicted Fe-S-cluster redox enzyme, YLON B.subtilis homolog n=1 Tax=Clostridium acetobutylicum (strain ATCC 824 / DSM 792 / JCM 1419 / IAM 19013 / LMG 5710 / NBRC 13948 / NRRL B-527 / VKM B-1787 / 2291 / W) TaxID=272562 RepID=Q97JT3_CLOAB|nr:MULTISPECIES: radical SAM protein [Clostridium]AAK79162.1 Predicted Fe-S-cluster redox enzyme, YLON B.subtilis homolog [Clostridium acetobutylicum ATCC 824]ADZ20240.1 Fe-S-cluster redox enzyme [Clostridium acetobutylicum EA 2018]AEI31697.1 Fe-S-cluster redox protein [Clostridium acetobutylicum DSM 1731]AWV81586.1 radical SAM protein [Clostridium acetobutylicum]MBC2393226.1 radical SAM protein [Clostridium acetobutylicum]
MIKESIILKNLEVPTGNICVIKGDKGKLEFLSLGDYGKEVNVKADFLGITRDLEGVPNGKVQPLTKKWVVTMSTQYGCDSGCKFCDVPKVGKGVNVTYNDLKTQLEQALNLHPEIDRTERLNIHYARMGEPSWNNDVLDFTRNLKNIVKPYIGESLIHPVFTTMCPNKNKFLAHRINEWVDIKNNLFQGDAGLQLSINSTNENQRRDMFRGNALTLNEISSIGNDLPMPKGRKYCLNFALADEYEVDAKVLKKLFDPSKFMVKITPLHKTVSSIENDIKTTKGYVSYTPYKDIENDLKKMGFDVLVFVPSYDEDLGRITCGNVILSGSLPKCKYKIN